MPTAIHFSDSGSGGVGTTIRLDSGEPCLLSLAQTGVRVKKSRSGILGPILYHEKNVHLATKTAVALTLLFPVVRFPRVSKHPVLLAFANAIWHCENCSRVAHFLNEAVALSEGYDETNADRLNRIRALVPDIVPAYGEIMEKWPSVIFPLSKLPLPKADMKIAFQLAWGMTSDEHLRASAELAYLHLCHFRDDVLAPIDPTLQKEATPHEISQTLTPFLAISMEMQNEQAELAEEFSKFKRLSSV